MAYSDFDLDTLRDQFGLHIIFTTSAFAGILPVATPADLLVTLQKNRPLAVGNGTKKAREAYFVVFNEQKKKPTPIVYGSVTSGSGWRFLRLHENEVTVDLTEYGLSELDKILGVLLYMARGDEDKTAA